VQSRWRRAAALVIGAGLIGVLSAPVSLARFSDADPASGSAATDTLEPPTALAASVAGATVTLGWTPTVDAYAAGYDVYRSGTSGGPYTLDSSVTPRSATSTTDAPGNGTWYYVLRSTYQAWTSLPSGQAAATVGSSSTTSPYAGCTSQAAETILAGDNNGYEANPLRACTDDGLTANDDSSGTGGTQVCGVGAIPSVLKDQHRFWGYALGLPGTVSAIEGITVRADLGQNNNGGSTALCVQLSADAGLTWTTLKSVAVTSNGQTTYTLGGPSDTWGRTWALADFATTTFRVRVVDASSQNNKQFELDYIAVSVTYRP
jgi:hypothetical protein